MSASPAPLKAPVTIGDDEYYVHPDDVTAWSDMRLWPSVTSGDIVYYLVNSKACDLQEVKAYKSLESYDYLQCGWVGKLSAHKVNEDTVYVKGEVRPSQAVNNKPHSAWICAKTSGVVITAGCSCMAGKAKVCSHVGAVLWKIDLTVCKGLTGIACTDKTVAWNKGTKRNVEPSVLEDITFKLEKQTVDPSAGNSLSSVLPRSIPGNEKEFEDSIKRSPFRFLFDVKGTLLYDTLHAPRRAQEQPLKEEASDSGHANHDTDDDLPYSCVPCTRFYSDLVVLSPSAAAALERSTRGQDTQLWYDARRLRLTASNVRRVPKRETTSCEKAARSIAIPSFMGNAATNHGKVYESVAREQFMRKTGLIVEKCGTFINDDYPWLSASPDGVIQSENAILEIKCPHVDDCRKMIEKGKYDVKLGSDNQYVVVENGPNGYFSQVQFQMLCSGRQLCYFYVWTASHKGKDRDVLVQVQFDAK